MARKIKYRIGLIKYSMVESFLGCLVISCCNTLFYPNIISFYYYLIKFRTLSILTGTFLFPSLPLIQLAFLVLHEFLKLCLCFLKIFASIKNHAEHFQNTLALLVCHIVHIFRLSHACSLRNLSIPYLSLLYTHANAENHPHISRATH